AERDALLAALGQLAHRAQRVHRLGQRELLAGEGLRKAAAAHLAPVLEPPVDLQELAPGRALRLAREQVAEDDSVPAQVLPRHRLEVLAARLFLHGAQERPAPARALQLAVEERAQRGDAVAGGAAARDQLPEPRRELAPVLAQRRAQLV